MIIEFLFPELANLFGELGDMDYLRRIFPDGRFYETQILESPRFLNERVDLVFMAPMSERAQALVIKTLMPFKEEIRARIEAGQHLMFLGNAQEVLGQRIINEDGSFEEGLGLFPLTAKRQMMKRLSSLFLGDYNGLPLVGFKAQFTQLQLAEDDNCYAFCQVVRGIGLYESATCEGIHYKNFIGHAILGPFLISNPKFTQTYLREVSGNTALELPFYDLAVQAYEKRLSELRDPKSTL